MLMVVEMVVIVWWSHRLYSDYCGAIGFSSDETGGRGSCVVVVGVVWGTAAERGTRPWEHTDAGVVHLITRQTGRFDLRVRSRACGARHVPPHQVAHCAGPSNGSFALTYIITMAVSSWRLAVRASFNGS